MPQILLGAFGSFSSNWFFFGCRRRRLSKYLCSLLGYRRIFKALLKISYPLCFSLLLWKLKTEMCFLSVFVGFFSLVCHMAHNG